MSANVESFTSWSTTLTNNQPVSTDTADLVSDLTKIQAEVRKYVATKGADIASATTTDLATATGNYVHITGTTTITGLGTVSAGLRMTLVFDGSLILTHNATSLILPNGVNITTRAGDVAEFISLGSGNWRCIAYNGDQFMRDYASVKDYGALGDGSTDDAAAFNLAIAAINAGTITYLHIPTGTYVIGSALDAITADNWTIMGDGESSTLVMKTTVTPNTLSNFFTVGSTTVSADYWRISGLHFLNENTATMGTTNAIVVEQCVVGYIDHIHADDVAGFLTLGTSSDTVARRVSVSNCKVEIYGPAGGVAFDILLAYVLSVSNVLITLKTDGANVKGIHVHPNNDNVIDSHKWERVEFNFPNSTTEKILVMEATDGIIVNQWFSNCVFDHSTVAGVSLLVGAGATANSRYQNIFFNSCRVTAQPGTTSIPVVMNTDTAREIKNVIFNSGVLIAADNSCVVITQTGGDDVTAVFNSITFFDGTTITNPASADRPAVKTDLGNIVVTGCFLTTSHNQACHFDYGVQFTEAAQDFVISNNNFNEATIADVDVSNLATSGQDNKIIANNIAPKRAMPAAVQTTDAINTILMAQSLKDESTYNVRAVVSAVKSDGTARATYEIVGTFYRTGAGNVVQQGSTTVVHSVESDAAWDCVFFPSSTAIQVRVTGAAATTVNWVGRMEFTQVTEA